MEAFENQQAAARDAAIAQGIEFEPEEREWPEIILDEFRTQEQKYVICIDTMGQDREITDEQKQFTLETVERYIEIWEKEERVALEADRDRRLEALEVDPEAGVQNDAVMAQEIAGEIEDFEFKQGDLDSVYFQKIFVEEPTEEE